MELADIIRERIETLNSQMPTYENQNSISVLEEVLDEFNSSRVKTVVKLKAQRISQRDVIDGLNSTLAKGETNDCVVKTLATVMGWTYEESHTFCKEELGRKNRQGVHGTARKLKEAKDSLPKTIERIYHPHPETGVKGIYYVQPNKNITKMSIRRFIQKHPTGTFIILVRQHAFALVDGVIIGNYKDSQTLRKIVLSAFKVI